MPDEFCPSKIVNFGPVMICSVKSKVTAVKLDLARTDFPIAFYLCYRYFTNGFYFEKENIEINGARHIQCSNVLFC